MRIAIAGYGVEGRANYDYWVKDPSNQLTIVDESEQPKTPLPDGVATILGPGAFEKLDGFDLVIRTAGLAPYKIKTDGKTWSATNEFFEKCPAPIIGVTGTKGKGTTSTMIASILEAAGKKVWLIGNIGVPAIDKLEQISSSDFVVFELSSFQLWDLERSPHIAVVLGVEPEHLDVHKDFQDYVSAKANIRRHQTDDDICIFFHGNDNTRHIVESSSKGRTIRYAIPDDGGVYIYDHQFEVNEHIICSTSVLQVPGDHNKENACAAITVAKQLNISDESIEQGLKSFEGLPHRIEFVRTVDGVDYYNDSFSSSTPAVYAAITSFEKPEIIIMGGVDRGGDFEQLAADISGFSNLKMFILVGEIRHKLAEILYDEHIDAEIREVDAKTMPEIVAYARAVAAPGDVVLLSPGCASFDMFKDFYDRGDQFRESVRAL